MMTIHKFQIFISGEVLVEMPAGSRLLCVGEQDGKLCIWALVNTKLRIVQHKFRIYGTGEEIDTAIFENEDSRYIGTVQMKNGLVWHVFDCIDSAKQ
jgi:hypothetical protein